MTDPEAFTHLVAAYYTLGCKLNFAETSTIGQSLLEQGVRSAKPGERANICVINTCSVTELANKKCRYMIRKAQREHPGAFVIVTGCYAQLEPEEVASLEGVHLVVGGAYKLNIAEHLQSIPSLNPSTRHLLHSPTASIQHFESSISSDERTRYFLKVQDGCDYQCSYCTIPRARGASRNGSIDSLVRDAQRIVAQGGLEIVLTGVNIGDFGRSTGETFLMLLQALDQVDGLIRLRMSSIEPNLLTEEVIDYALQSQKIAPHFHLPLQSGSNSVLQLMKRRYNRELFSRRIDYIHRQSPDAFIGIDVIAGMRGETEAFFQETLDYLSALHYAQLHVFSYSERPGTAALDITHRVDNQERNRRSQRLQSLSKEKLQTFYQHQIGRPLRVIWEEGKDEMGYMSGYSDNYVRIGRPYDAQAIGSVSTITPGKIADHRLLLIE